MKRFLAAVMVLLSVVTLSGCKEVPSFMPSFWDGLTKAGAREYIQNALRDKYGEEFEVVSIGVRSGQYYRELVGTCSPKSDENIVFNYEVNNFGGERTVYDEYIRNVIRKQMKENIDNVLSKYYETFASEVNVMPLHPSFDSGIRSASEATVKAFSESFAQSDEKDTNKTGVWIVINKSESADIDKLNNAIQEMTLDFYSLYMCIDCFFGDQETINICNEKANDIKSNHFEVMNITYDSDFRRDGFVYYEEELVYIPNVNSNKDE
ncbi:MAG: hypothetical protein HDT43_00445 [Ruminococcaceae bacterium]|nr:hypothetical protein [Oscillospiraceae bacterium]